MDAWNNAGFFTGVSRAIAFDLAEAPLDFRRLSAQNGREHYRLSAWANFRFNSDGHRCQPNFPT